MARKRKIPARKHHGIRDPLKQLEEKEKKLKNCINNPPDKGGEQKISYKFAQFKKLADDVKAGKKLSRIHSGREDKPQIEMSASRTQKCKASVISNKFRAIKQMVEEKDEEYLKRVNRITAESLKEAEYEAKYGVSVLRNPRTGEISVKKKAENEIDALLKQKKMSKKGKVKITKPTIDARTAKALIKQAIKEDEEDKKSESIGVPEYKRDSFRFGEVVHGPPILSTLPRKAGKSDTVPRPGKKQNLLLKRMLDQTTNDPSKNKIPEIKSKPISIKLNKEQLKLKRKDLPKSTRLMLEQEQNKIIELYRNLKKSKYHNL